MQEIRINDLMVQSHSGDPEKQISAIHGFITLKVLPDEFTIAVLVSSLDPVVRLTTARALGILGREEMDQAAHALSGLLADPEWIVRAEAVDALGVLGYKPATAAVKSLLLKDPEAVVRASAAETLGDLGDTQALAELVVALKDIDENVRSYAASSIGLLGDSSILAQLQSQINMESSMRVKAELLGARYRIGASDDINLLLDLLATTDEITANAILNMFSDFIWRKSPPTLRKDLPLLSKKLMLLSNRIKITRAHVNEILENLSKRES